MFGVHLVANKWTPVREIYRYNACMGVSGTGALSQPDSVALYALCKLGLAATSGI